MTSTQRYSAFANRYWLRPPEWPRLVLALTHRRNVFRLVYSLEVCGKMDNLTKLTAAGILISGRISGLPNTSLRHSIQHVTHAVNYDIGPNSLISAVSARIGSMRSDVVISHTAYQFRVLLLFRNTVMHF